MIDDGDAPEFFAERSQKARKIHHCAECGREISVGELYWTGFSLQYGVSYFSKMCAHCRVAAEWLCINCNGYIYAAVIEDFGQHAEANVPMLRIVVGARRQWRSFADAGRLLPVPIYPADML